MIPGVMVDFLSRASVGVASTRDGSLVPRVHFLSGWWVTEDREHVVCLVGRGFEEGLDEAVRRGDPIAMTAEVIGPHETYQFKGRLTDLRPARDTDGPVHAASRERFRAAVGAMHPQVPDEVLRSRIRPPVCAVQFRVEAIYLQTPGPGAGERLYPREP